MLVKNLPPIEIEVPHEPGNYFSFRRLNAGEMDEAQAAAVKETMARYGPQAMESLSKMTVTDQARQEGQDDPLAGHSEEMLVRYGLVSWRGSGYPSDDFSDEMKKELDPPTRRWAALQVLEVSNISEGEAQRFADGSGRNGPQAASRSESPVSGTRS